MANNYNQQIKRIYDFVSGFYDSAHHLQTLWADDIHRREAVKHADLIPGCLVLDIGTGTALTARMAKRTYPGVNMIGVDLSMGMLQQAKKNTQGLEIKLTQTDAQKLPFLDNIFDAVISAYGFGGIQDTEKAMQEVVRVAKPFARISFAEMSEPPKEKYIKRFLHKHIIEPWIKYFWYFRDLDLTTLFENNNVLIEHKKFFSHRVLGSTALVSGTLQK